MNRTLLLVSGVLLLAAPALAVAQEQTPAPRDPAQPYSSWGEALRETAEAIGDRTLVRPADDVYAVGDAVIFNDDGKRYRAHVIGFESGRYAIRYDGFGPSWTRRVGADALLGYQPGYVPPRRAAAAASAPQVGDELEAQFKGKWYEARVIATRQGEYRVHFDGQPNSADEWVPRSRVRFLAGGPARTVPLKPGRYGCSRSRYSARAGGYQFDPKGSVVLFPDGRYQYLGFAQPSPGRYTVDTSASVVSFTGGHLDGGEATPVVQGPGRFYLTAPAIGERWACGSAVDGK